MAYEEKSTDVSREKRGKWRGNKGARETDQGMALKNFKVCPRFASFSNLRAVALNSCKYLSNVQLTGVCVHEGGKRRKQERGGEMRE